MNSKFDIVMVDPLHYDVKYAINPHMMTADGRLKKVDRALARKQWESLKSLYESLGLKVGVVPAVEGLPDMVFAANQCLPFVNAETGETHVVMSRMRSAERQPEVVHFENWYATHGYLIERLETECVFEGCGDALLIPAKNLLVAGHGFRTDIKAYWEISQRFGFEIFPLKLARPEFYHLDTCMAVLNPETVAILPDAFGKEDLANIRANFTDVIELDYQECLEGFAANLFCPNGGDVIIQSGNSKSAALVGRRGFRVHEIDTGEFVKAGGSVFCLKMHLPIST